MKKKMCNKKIVLVFTVLICLNSMFFSVQVKGGNFNFHAIFPLLSSSYSDCLGDAGGSAYIDDCGTCDDDPQNDCTQESCDLSYAQEIGSATAAVGNSESRNAYRGIYWTGETKTVCSVGVELVPHGDISSIDYKVTIWEVDIHDNLKLIDDPLVTSETVNGSTILAAVDNPGPDDYWVTFQLPSPTLLTSGKTVVLVSRVDPDVRDSHNYVGVRQNYDENDLENEQWNSHYYSDGVMAGRKAGDEDQPEYFACNMRLYGHPTVVDVSNEVPNMPNDVEVVAIDDQSLSITWVSRDVGVAVQSYNIYEYTFSGSSYFLTLLGTTSGNSYTHSGLNSNSEHYYVVTAVSVAGGEGYHSLKNSRFQPDWHATTL